jgi:hypothetical protein
MSRREVWEKIYRRFDPDEHVTDPRWRADRPLSPARRIIEILASPFASDARILVTGAAGAGKTTELLRVAGARASHELVVLLDVARYFEILTRDENQYARIDIFNQLLHRLPVLSGNNKNVYIPECLQFGIVPFLEWLTRQRNANTVHYSHPRHLLTVILTDTAKRHLSNVIFTGP